MNEPIAIAVAVPTFKRPLGLEKCLRSLAAMPTRERFCIIVADNDAEGQQGIATCRRLVAEGFPIGIEAVVSHDRGIAPTRNVMVATALKYPGIRSIAMIDDDEWVDPVWLDEMLRIQRETHADVVGGPVQRTFEIPVPSYIYNTWSGQRRASAPSGAVDLVHATSNVLFDAALFRGMTPPWFDLKFALMGCEDKDLMVRLKAAGRTFAWAQRAVVTEEMPASRCSLKWVVTRSYRVGNTDMAVTLKNRASDFSYVTEVVRTLGGGAVGLATMILLFWDRQRRFDGLLQVARAVGKIAGLFGSQYQEYRVVHGR